MSSDAELAGTLAAFKARLERLERRTGPEVGARLWRNVDQLIAVSTVTDVVMTTVLAGDPAWLSGGFLVVPPGLDGLYLLSAHVSWEGAALATPMLFISVNGVSLIRDFYGINTGAFTNQHATVPRHLAAGDVVKAVVYHTTAAAKNVRGLPASGTDPHDPVLEAWRFT